MISRVNVFAYGIIIIFYTACFLYIKNSISNEYYLNPGQEYQSADVVVVFFGGYKSSGEVDDESMRRFNFATELVKYERARNIIFVGGRRKSGDLRGSRILAEMAAARGIDRHKIHYDVESNDTGGNIREAWRIIQEREYEKVLLLSSSYHLVRIHLMDKPESKFTFRPVTYRDEDAVPRKGILEGFTEYNYNIISHALYIILSEKSYSWLVNVIR